MSWKVISILLMIWLIGQFICLVFEGTYIGEDENAVLNPMVVFRNPVQDELYATVTPDLEVFTEALPKILMWDYSWFEGNYVLIQYLLYCLSAGIVFGFIVGLVTGNLFSRG